MYPNTQAYDRAVMFSPDGKLFQVEYAKEAVKRGATSIGIVCKDSVVFVAHKNIVEKLMVPSTIQKIFKIDVHIGATYSGLVPDALYLIDVAREIAQNHRFVFNETKSIEALVKGLANQMMQATQYGGLRPYGVSFLIGGYDNAPRLYELGPDASLAGYKADAIGFDRKQATEILEKEYKDGMSVEEGIALGIKVLKHVKEGKLDESNVDVAYAGKDMPYYQLEQDEIKKYLSE